MTRQLSPIEAEAYFLTTLDIWQTRQRNDEPTLEEYRDLAEMLDNLARLKAASEAREEIHDPFVLPWLERALPRLREHQRYRETSSVDERAEAEHTGLVIVAYEDLIERAKAYEQPATCWLCNGLATLQDTSTPDDSASAGDAWCENCARSEFAKRVGEVVAIREVAEALFMGLNEIGGAARDAVCQVLKGGLHDRVECVGAERAQEDWIMAHRDRHHAEAYLSQFEPLTATVEVAA